MPPSPENYGLRCRHRIQMLHYTSVFCHKAVFKTAKLFNWNFHPLEVVAR